MKAMMAWLPAADALVDMIAAHVPSPACAQRLRAPLLYAGDSNDSSFRGIYNCDPTGPAVVYISKMAPSGERSKRLLAFGRVFSGTVRVGDSLRALRTDGKERTAKIAQIKICSLGGRMHSIQSTEAGQLIALEGVDEALGKAGTLTSALDGLPIRHMHFAVMAVVQHSVRPKDKKELTKMVAELQQVVNADSTALFYKDQETQEYILAGAGELHIEVLVSSFYQSSGIEIELSEPIIAYRETVQSVSDKAALAKSDNKHNRVWIKAFPLSNEIVKAMTTGELSNLDSKDIGKALRLG
jgi:elongation factor 2